MIHSLVANGQGYSILNFQPGAHYNYDNKPLAYVGIKEHYPSLQVVMAWLAQSRLTRRARLFIAAAKAYIATTPYATLQREDDIPFSAPN